MQKGAGAKAGSGQNPAGNGKRICRNAKDAQKQVTGMLNTLLSTFLSAEEKVKR